MDNSSKRCENFPSVQRVIRKWLSMYPASRSKSRSVISCNPKTCPLGTTAKTLSILVASGWRVELVEIGLCAKEQERRGPRPTQALSAVAKKPAGCRKR